MRQIVLDTETTGLEVSAGHRVIEIGAVELVNRRLTGTNYHQYLNPGRDIEEGAKGVHGITEAFLEDKPSFGEVWPDFLEFVSGSELIIHNAPFDVGFLNAEIRLLAGHGPVEVEQIQEICSVIDSLTLARHLHPGQKNNLDALCRRYMVDNSSRTLHGALLDAEILADVYLAMTGGQTQLFGAKRSDQPGTGENAEVVQYRPALLEKLRLVRADSAEQAAHEALLNVLDSNSDSATIWRKL